MELRLARLLTAFTLVELLIVIAIMDLLVKADLPPFPLPPDKSNRIAKALKLCPQMKELTELILLDQSDKQIVSRTGLALPTVRS